MIAYEDQQDFFKERLDRPATLDLHEAVQDVAQGVSCHHAHLIDEENIGLLHNVAHDVIVA